MQLEEHPTVRSLANQGQHVEHPQEPDTLLEGAWLRRLAMECGADDAGLVDIMRPALDAQRDEILRHYPWTKSLLSFVVRMAREPVRGAPRSVANLEFHRAGDEVNEISAAIVATLEARGIRAVNPSMDFPMEMYQSGGGAIWIVAHKPVAVEAGLGHLGERLYNREQTRFDPASPYHLYPNGQAITIERLRQDDCRMTGGIESRAVGTYHPILYRLTIALERRSCFAVRLLSA